MLWSEKMFDMTSVFKIYWGLICDPRCDLSRRMFHVHLRRMCILLSDGMFYKYQLSPSDLMHHLRPCFLFDFLPGWPVQWCKRDVKASLYVCQFLFLWLLAIILYIEVPLCWVHIYLHLLHFLLRLKPRSLCSVLLCLL